MGKVISLVFQSFQQIHEPLLFLPIYLDPTPIPLAAGPGSTGSGNAIPGNEKTGKGLGTTTRAEARVVPDLELEAEVVRKRATGNGNVLTEKFRRKGDLRFSKRKFETFLEMSTSLCKAENNTHHWGKDHCTAALQFNKTGTQQKKKIYCYLYVVRQLNP